MQKTHKVKEKGLLSVGMTIHRSWLYIETELPDERLQFYWSLVLVDVDIFVNVSSFYMCSKYLLFATTMTIQKVGSGLWKEHENVLQLQWSYKKLSFGLFTSQRCVAGKNSFEVEEWANMCNMGGKLETMVVVIQYEMSTEVWRRLFEGYEGWYWLDEDGWSRLNDGWFWGVGWCSILLLKTFQGREKIGHFCVVIYTCIMVRWLCWLLLKILKPWR